MAATRKFYVRRNTTPIKKVAKRQPGATSGSDTITPIGGGEKNIPKTETGVGNPKKITTPKNNTENNTTTGDPKTGTDIPQASGTGDAAPRKDNEIHDNSSGGKSTNVEYKGPAGQVKAKEVVQNITGISSDKVSLAGKKKALEAQSKENKEKTDQEKADKKAKEEFEKERADKRFIRQPDETPKTEETKENPNTNEAYSDVKPTDVSGENTNQWAYGALDASDVKDDEQTANTDGSGAGTDADAGAETSDDGMVEFNELEIPEDVARDYKRYALTDAAAGALNVTTKLMDTALEGWGAMIKFANRLFLGNKISDPTGAARALVDGITSAGAVAQRIVDDSGAFWGIKDGVQQKDVIGTYKGARHYKELAEMKAVQREFSTDLDSITKEVFGEDADPKNLDKYLEKAIADRDVGKVRGVIMGLKKKYDSPRMRQYEAMVNKEISDKNNDAIPKEQKYRAPPAAKMYHRMHMEFMRGAVNSAEKIGALSAREAAQIRHETQNMGERRNLKKKENQRDALQARVDESDAADAERKKNEENWYNGLDDVGRSFADVIRKYDNTAFNELASSEGMPVVTDPTKLNRIIKQMRLRKSQVSSGKSKDDWSDEEEKVLQHLENLASQVGGDDERTDALTKDINDLKEIYDGPYSNGRGGSSDPRQNNMIKRIAVKNLNRLKGQESSKEYKDWYAAYTAAVLTEKRNYILNRMRENESLLRKYFAYTDGKGKSVWNWDDTLQLIDNNWNDASNYFGAYGTNDADKVQQGIDDRIHTNLDYDVDEWIREAEKLKRKGVLK